MKKQSYKFKTGIFIVASILLLMFGIVWLRYFSLRPAMTIMADFYDPGPLSKGYHVYFRGAKVGKVDDVEFANDFENVYVYIKIFRKKLKIPANVKAKVHTAGITGRKYIDLSLQEPISTEILKNNDVIEGEVAFGFANIQNFLEKQFEEGRFEEMFDSLHSNMEKMDEISANINAMTKTTNNIIQGSKVDIEKIVADGAKATENINDMVMNFNDIMGPMETCGDVRTTLNTITGAAAGINEFVDSDIQGALDEFNCALRNISATFYDLDNIIQQPVKSKGCQSSSTPVLAQTIANTNTAIKKFECVNDGLSDMLSKRFLFFRTLFGKPGDKLAKCKYVN